MFIKDTHNHPRDDSAIVVKKLVNDLKSKMQDNIRPVPQLYLEEIQRVAAVPNADEVAANLPPFSVVKSALYRQRRKLIPALPSTRAEVAFEGEWAQTANGKSFLLAEDGGDDKMVIFASEDDLRRLAEAEYLYVDGTFHICPNIIFYQVFTVHAVMNRVHMPLAYCLLPNKRQETYERVFTLQAEKAQTAFGILIAPSVVVSDFELGIMQAERAVFPAVVSKGCYFHFCQALIRKLQQLGLQTAYQEDREVASFVPEPGYLERLQRSPEHQNSPKTSPKRRTVTCEKALEFSLSYAS